MWSGSGKTTGSGRLAALLGVAPGCGAGAATFSLAAGGSGSAPYAEEVPGAALGCRSEQRKAPWSDRTAPVALLPGGLLVECGQARSWRLESSWPA
eukprot:CAMPEP_0170626536 /NCGR_PEP_ID=MMETSP0224-20130122/31413_1 /TAXON_ID=285029 /ORGANISM="Togula jolla, Strain CCCM 725" /LENGTH=95 /DNA_ID=CAMNT_0010953321 /DNA_START=162 /DNA_END=446 /DNA_ORIENTATION=+